METNIDNLYSVTSPNGERVAIPVDVTPEHDIYAQLKTPQQIKDYYDEHGYVVVRGLIPPELCDKAHKKFADELKPYQGFIYRQTATGGAEKHRFTAAGYMENSILNIQDLDAGLFPSFKEAGLNVLTHTNIQETLRALFLQDGKLVQSMFFEGNPATWAHQDSYYLDSEKIGNMTAAWIAVEDIKPGAGRFFVYPGSHKIDISKNGGNFDIAFNHERYKQLVIDIINQHKLTMVAPALRKGDALFWASKTIHGSLGTTQPEFSRASFTAHFIPVSDRFIQYQKRIRTLHLTKIHNMLVHHPKDQEKLFNRIVMGLESRFPLLYGWLKKIAIKIVVR